MWRQGPIRFQKGKQVLLKTKGKRGTASFKNIDDGKVHVLVWRNKMWVRHCDGGRSGKTGIQTEFRGDVVDDKTPLTCLTCKDNWEWSPES